DSGWRGSPIANQTFLKSLDIMLVMDKSVYVVSICRDDHMRVVSQPRQRYTPQPAPQPAQKRLDGDAPFCILPVALCRRFCETFLGVVFVSSRLLTLPPLSPFTGKGGRLPVGPPHESGAAAGGQTLVSVLPALRVRQGFRR
ncbi:unnamed protein product, partial [Pleuronectes platessa]